VRVHHADGDGLNAADADTEGALWCEPRGAAGVHEARGRRGQKRQERGRPSRLRPRLGDARAGIAGPTDHAPRTGHPRHRGRPEPHRGSRRGPPGAAGRLPHATRRAADGREGVRSAPRTRRAGEPPTGGRGGQADAAGPGPMDRAGRIGEARHPARQGRAEKAKRQGT
jgi:hypothetical protein